MFCFLLLKPVLWNRFLWMVCQISRKWAHLAPPESRLCHPTRRGSPPCKLVRDCPQSVGVAGNFFWSPSLPSLPSLVMLIVSPTKQSSSAFGTRGMHLLFFFSFLIFQFSIWLLILHFLPFFSQADQLGNPGSLGSRLRPILFDEGLNELVFAVLTYRESYANISRVRSLTIPLLHVSMWLTCRYLVVSPVHPLWSKAVRM